MRIQSGDITQASNCGRAVGFALLFLALAAGSALASPLSPGIQLDRTVIFKGENQPVYVLIKFDVPERQLEPGKERPRINLALVLDRSSSMSQRGKLTYAKKAAKVVVDMLTQRDRLAVVEYDDQITVLWPSTPVEAQEMVKRLIDGLTARGATNLTGGMMKGVDQALEHLDPEGINRVILLSDGLAKRGITRPAQIVQLVRETTSKGVTITTAGLGLRYDEDLMQAIAEHGKGNYYYIENPALMS